MNQPGPPDPALPRLTSRPFPAYRFLNQGEPHPARHPDGHSFGLPEPDCAAEQLAAVDGHWRQAPQFCYGVDLYNYAFWWEAHEAWEALWKTFPPEHPLRHALQCLIQVSAAHLQRFTGRTRGSRVLLERARGHLTAANVGADVVLGLRLEAWWTDAVAPYFAAPEQRPYPFLRPE